MDALLAAQCTVRAECRLFSVLIILLLAGCCPGVLFGGEQGGRTSWARHGMVVSGDSCASAAGLEILRAGGNAVDAAAAVGFALAVTYPEAGNIGGGGLMVVRAADGASSMIDFRETAPRKASRTMFLDKAGNPIPEKSLIGGLAAGVPGTVAGLLTAQERYGRLSRQLVLAPALRLAKEGFRVGHSLARSLRQHAADSSMGILLPAAFQVEGRPIAEGDTLRQPALARTLDRIAKQGRVGFYRGRVARAIAKASQRSGGVFSVNDLARYRAIVRTPLVGTYRGATITTAAPPSGGGVILLEILNILQQYPLRAMGRDSVLTWHLFSAAAQRAFADRATYLGDPGFTTIPLDSLLAPEYARDRAASIDPQRATASATIAAGTFAGEHGTETTHYCVVDSEGNAVSTTVTLNGYYGCKVYVEDAGFFLNNEMDDFSVKPGVPNMFGLTGGEANAIAPGKRMLSSMTPTVVTLPDGSQLLVGGRGGSRIPTAVAQVIMNVVDFGLDIRQAAVAPRVHHQWLPDRVSVEATGDLTDLPRHLEAMGYTVHVSEGPNGKVQAIFLDGHGRGALGGPDPRENGVALGY